MKRSINSNKQQTTKQTLFNTASIFTLLLLSSHSFAQESSNTNQIADVKKPDSVLSVGATAMYTNSAYDVDDKVRVLPSIFYDNGSVYFKGIQFGAYVYDDSTNKVTAFIQPGGSKFDPDDANGALRGLEKRKVSGMAGLGYQRRLPYAIASAQVATDVLDHSKGTAARVSVGTRLPVGKFMVMPSVGIQWVDDNYNDYYYGISQQESINTGVSAYEADSSFNPYINISANYKINEDWSLFLGQNVSYLPNEQYDSPMVDDRFNYRTTLGVTYDF